jgi:hypothetical protein
MSYRAGLLAIAVLTGSGLLFWNPFAGDPSGPAPLLSPPGVSQPADAAPTATSFGVAGALPKQLSDESFWKMISEFSEPDGYFMYENFLSNEKSYEDPIPRLTRIARTGGVYLGVGPEQNFTYIAALRPQMAFIIDIRRQNMLELLMYKALFETADNRGDFVSLLFSRKRPSGIDENSSAEGLFHAFAEAQPDRQLFENNLKRIKSRLRLSEDDAHTLEHVYGVFFSVGPRLNYASVSPGPSGPTYEELMTLTDAEGHNWSFLAGESNYRFVREMQEKNLIIPLVGDFTGPKAVRTVGRYLKDHKAKVSAFYLSNVEMYILPSPEWKSFCTNVAALPVDGSSMFIRFVLAGYAQALPATSYPWSMSTSVVSPMIDVLTGVVKGYPPSYYDLLHASR